MLGYTDQGRSSDLLQGQPIAKDEAAAKPMMAQAVGHIYGLFLMARPLFVLGVGPLYLLGLAVAWHQARALDLGLAVAGWVVVALVQLMTHFGNEYWDLETDKETARPTRFSGGSQAIVAGMVPRRAAFIVAVACLLAALAAGSALQTALGSPNYALAIVGVAIFIGWFYSAWPLRFEARGIGEICVAVASALLVPLLAYHLQTLDLVPIPLAASLPLLSMAFAVQLTAELPDREADRQTGKRTLVVRLGPERAALLRDLAMALSYVLVVPGIFLGLPWPAWLFFLAGLPLLAVTARLARRLDLDDAASLERACFFSALALELSALALAAGFVAAP